MQVKTQLLIQDIAKMVLIVIGVCIALYVTRLDDDSDTDTDFPKQTNTVDVHVKQLNGINHVVYRECVLLAERVECL
jgi:hypothetical protein